MANIFVFSRLKEPYIIEGCLPINYLQYVSLAGLFGGGKGRNKNIIVLFREKNMVEINKRNRERGAGERPGKTYMNEKAEQGSVL